jgi:hypothetical protein
MTCNRTQGSEDERHVNPDPEYLGRYYEEITTESQRGLSARGFASSLRRVAGGTLDRVGDQTVGSLRHLHHLGRLRLADGWQVIDETIEKIFG